MLRAKEEEEIQRILAEFSSMCAGIGNDILTDFDQAIRLNLIFSKARLAEQMKATVPELSLIHIFLMRISKFFRMNLVLR